MLSPPEDLELGRLPLDNSGGVVPNAEHSWSKCLATVSLKKGLRTLGQISKINVTNRHTERQWGRSCGPHSPRPVFSRVLDH